MHTTPRALQRAQGSWPLHFVLLRRQGAQAWAARPLGVVAAREITPGSEDIGDGGEGREWLRLLGGFAREMHGGGEGG